jgi:acetyl-CoA synthetase
MDWRIEAEKLVWRKSFDKVLEGGFSDGEVRWFEGGELNASENCLDRHLASHGLKTALIWEGNEPGKSRKYTYQELYEAVCRFANVLKKQGIKKGDRVCLYMPMSPEGVIAMLACARLGAIHSVVFGGFSAEALSHRISDAKASCVITVNAAYRGEKLVHFKANVDVALSNYDAIPVIVVDHTLLKVPMGANDVWYHEAMSQVDSECEAVSVPSNHPLFILYTSGSTGKPKGIVHGTGGYLTYVTATYHAIFGGISTESTPYFCTADIGWITGHSYVVYGPLSNAETILIYEGTPEYPSPSRLFEMIDRYQVSIFYTAPTLIRSLMRHGEAPLKGSTLTSLKLLGSVGEPLNPETWRWFNTFVGKNKCPIMDTWWQTETGGVMMVPPRDLQLQKPASVMQPFLGVNVNLIDENHKIIEGEGQGDLVISEPWPGMLQGVYGNSSRFHAAYLNPHPGHYTSGDWAYRDKDGHYWITGRLDDVLNVSGHRLGTAEIESAIVSHPSVVEAAVVGFPHELKGEAIYVYVTLLEGVKPSPELKNELIQTVRQKIGPIATPQFIQFSMILPKTRSGKIMRRILRQIAKGDTENLGDVSTLADPSCLADLIQNSLSHEEKN